MKENADDKNMKTLKAIHAILKIYDDCLDNEELDFSRLNAKALRISENRFAKIMIMLSESDYIGGVDVRQTNDGKTSIEFEDSYITLSGLKYYAENSLFLRAAGILPDVVTAGISTVAGAVL